MIVKNNWRLPAPAKVNGDSTVVEGDAGNDIDQIAAKEILEETQRVAEAWDSRTNGKPSNIEIPLFMQNRVPSGFETEDKVDTSLRADEVRYKLIDYLTLA